MPEFFDLGKSLSAASSYASTGLSLQKYATEQKDKNAVKVARAEAATGEPEAIQSLRKLAPKEATAIIESLSKADERTRELVKQQSEQTAKQMMWVEQGQTPEEKSQRFDSVIDDMVKQTGKQEHAKWKGKYSPDLSQNWIMKAMTIDDINEQLSFGQLKVAEKDGKPVYIHSNAAGQTREAPVPEGVSPTEKDFKGSSKGAGGFTMKSADSNSIYRSAAAFYGGIVDPQTGRVTGINPEQEKNVAAIAERAAQIYREGEGKISHNEATAEAAREMGIDVPKAKPRSIKDYLEAQRK